MRHFEIVVVGAGLAGSTVARLFAEKGKNVLIVEQHRHVAGHCHDAKNEAGITIHTYGPHIFHTNDKNVWDFVQRFTQFHYYQHRVLSYAEGRFIPFPIHTDTINEVFGMQLSSMDVASFLASQVQASAFENPPKTFRDAIVSQVGEKFYSLFFENYTRKQWERDPALLSVEVASRIPVRANRDGRYFSDRYQGIPKQGYSAMVEKMLDHPNISIMLGADWFDLKQDLDAQVTVFTGELDKFFGERYGKLEYRSLDLVLQTFDKEYFQPAAVVNYPNDYDWTRITEYKYFLDERGPKTTICFEYPKAEGEPYYIVMTKENMERREKYMREAEALERTGRWLFVGRLAEYKYYNMDQVIAAAIQKVGKI